MCKRINRDISSSDAVFEDGYHGREIRRVRVANAKIKERVAGNIERNERASFRQTGCRHASTKTQGTLKKENAIVSTAVAKRIFVANVETGHYVPTDGKKPLRTGDR